MSKGGPAVSIKGVINAPARQAPLRRRPDSAGSASPPLHVVSVGPYARYENALAEAERLKVAGFRDAFVMP